MVSRSAATSAIDPQSDPTQKLLQLWHVSVRVCVTGITAFLCFHLCLSACLPVCLSACLPACAARCVSIGNVEACRSHMDVGCLRSKRPQPGARRCGIVPRHLSDLPVSDDARCHGRIAPPDGRTPNAALFLPSAPKVPRVSEISVQCGCFAG